MIMEPLIVVGNRCSVHAEWVNSVESFSCFVMTLIWFNLHIWFLPRAVVFCNYSVFFAVAIKFYFSSAL